MFRQRRIESNSPARTCACPSSKTIARTKMIELWPRALTAALRALHAVAAAVSAAMLLRLEPMKVRPLSSVNPKLATRFLLSSSFEERMRRGVAQIRNPHVCSTAEFRVERWAFDVCFLLIWVEHLNFCDAIRHNLRSRRCPRRLRAVVEPDRRQTTRRVRRHVLR